jgi:hypothetical protein
MIRSLRRNDCGVCAVANALSCSWQIAADRIFGSAFRNKLAFSTKTKQIAIALHNYAPKLIRVKSWDDIPDRSVVKVLPLECEGTGNWHWVGWRDGMVWDNNNARPRSPHRYNCRLVSYLGSAS